MTDRSRDALITGIGLISCLGEGAGAHWAALDAPGGFAPAVDRERFAPFPVHPMAPLDLSRQIPRRGDQRQMEAWQHFGTYAAGLALDDAGVKGDTALLERMHMFVAAGGGERDYAADAAILTDLRHSSEPGRLLNERLLADLRPTLFLAQLSNLLAGNISIVHGVVGSSRTFMGEEASGTDAVRTAVARIAAGQGDLFLVGASYNAERPDVLLEYEMGGALWKDAHQGVWARQARGGGMIIGSAGCFLVIESRAHAEARGARGRARISAIESDRCGRKPGEASANAARQWERIGAGIEADAAMVISGASGIASVTAEERAFLESIGLPVRATATALGHTIEPSFPANLALAALAIEQGRGFAPLDPAGPEGAAPEQLRQVLVTAWGHWRGEGMALVEPA